MQSLSDKKLCSSSGLKSTGFGPNLRFLITLIAALALAGCDFASDITAPVTSVAPATDSTAPAEVGSLNAAAGNTQVVLTWTEPADGDFANVKITYPGSFAQWVVPKGTQTITITGLTNDTQYTFTVKTVDTAGNESAGITATASPAQPISLSETGTYTFPAVTEGYEAQTPLTVTVTNTGNQATGALTASLTGADRTSFTLAPTEISSLAAGGADTFTVVPNTALAVNTYTATVTVSDGNGITASFTVSFTVNNSAATYGISLSETGGYTFPSALKNSYGGYLSSNPRVVTVTNTGNQATGALTASLTGADSTSFTLSTTGISSIAVGYSKTFAVYLRDALPDKTHIATVTVSGGNGLTASFMVSVTVSTFTPTPTYGIRLDTQRSDYIFPAATAGYGAQTAKTVTVINEGNQATGPLTASLTGADSTSFTLSTTGISNIAAYGTATITVVPKTALAVRPSPYTATVMVSGGNGLTASSPHPVSFRVNPAPIYGIRLSETGTYTFKTVATNYGLYPPRTITVTNTGDQATGPLTVSITFGANYYPYPTPFILSTTGISSIPVGGTGSFMVGPMSMSRYGLSEGSYAAAITVSGSNGIRASFWVSLTVDNRAATYGIN
ncbi:hypothetical protein AGMMS49940_10900 [Spirochaetia bacterium]|nr:hypothetical protein AGMMS49940_10900 [Spirochaetia bacterium]